MSASSLTELGERVLANIPLARHLHFQLLEWDGASLTLSAPLTPNINDKGTFFAGSQSALLTLAGWACATLTGETVHAEVDVVAVRSSLEYKAPLAADARITVSSDGAARERFQQRLQRTGRASLTVSARLGDIEGNLASTFDATYMARVLGNL